MNRKLQMLKRAVLLISTLAIMSCSNIIKDDNVSGTNAYIKLTVDKARTVLPDITETNWSKFVLTGVKTETDPNVTPSVQTLGSWGSLALLESKSIPVSTGHWSFTLSADSNGTIFSGTLEKDIILGENALSFDLAISDSGTGTGSLNITLDFSSAANSSDVNYAVATLENLDGTEITDDHNIVIVPSQNITPSESKVTFAATDIPAGTYRARIKLYSEKGTEIATYRDLVQIATGYTSKDTQTIEKLDELYNVTYHTNGGLLPSGITLPETVTWKSVVNLPSLIYDGHTFAGWYTDENCTDGNEITRITNAHGNIDVYAKFKLPSYTITYMMNGGTNPDDAVSSFSVEDNVTLPVPTRDGKVFEGWYTSSLASVTSWSAGTHNESLILYAKWDGEILATASTVANTIRSMTTNGTVIVIGPLKNTEVPNINSALRANSSVLVALDLSQVTGLTRLEDAGQARPSNSFYQCSNLSKLILPDGLQYIGMYALRNCTKLTSITIPSSVSSFDMNQWDHCDSLHEVIYNGTLEQWMNKGWYMECQIDDLYINGEKLGAEVTIPSSMTSIGKNAFYNYRGLKSVTIPSNVTSIGFRAFENCTGLTSITIPSSITNIDSYAFDGCKGLTEITIDAGVTNIGSYAFGNCGKILFNGTLEQWMNISKNSFVSSSYDLYINGQKITSVTIPSGITEIGNSTFYNCGSINEVTIPSWVTKIEKFAFYGCNGLTEITIPSSVTQIGDSAFSRCNSLTEITIPSSVTQIGNSTFVSCSNLTSITIPSSVTQIGNSTFASCSNLTSITIPSSVTKIGNNAFSGCNGLTEIIIPSGVTQIGDSAFSSCANLTSITIPASVTQTEYSFSNCTKLNEVKYDGTLEQWLNKGWNLGFNYENLYISGEKLGTEITIPSNITSIGDYAFSHFKSLTKVIIESGATEIGQYAFWECTGLTSITIPDSVTQIGNSAFYRCTSLSEIIINSGLTIIEEYAFSYCSSLKEIVLPSSLIKIDGWAFYNCSGITKITIPSSVTQIGWYVFNDCTNLTSITFENPSNWYYTSNTTNWNNFTNGTPAAISDNASNNATTLKSSSNSNKYWYRKDPE